MYSQSLLKLNGVILSQFSWSVAYTALADIGGVQTVGAVDVKRAPLPLSTAGLSERSSPHQRCPGVSPTVRMGMAPVIVFDIPESCASKSAIERKSPRFKNRRPNTLNHSST